MATTSESFFQRYPAFFDTGNAKSSAKPGARLDARHHVLIEENLDCIRGKRILDLGSHDGRWAFAALQAGATHVLGIEARGEAIEMAQKNFELYSVPSSQYEFRSEDMLEFLRTTDQRFDTVFLFGMFYHIQFHVELVRYLVATGPSAFLLDTLVGPDLGVGPWKNTVSFVPKAPSSINNNPDELIPGVDLGINGFPSTSFVSFLFEQFGYEARELDWTEMLRVHGTEGMRDYERGTQRAFWLTDSMKRAIGRPPRKRPRVRKSFRITKAAAR